MARIETKMTLAFAKAANASLDAKTGYVGQRVLTNQLMGIGKMKPRETIKLKKKAETAVKMKPIIDTKNGQFLPDYGHGMGNVGVPA